MGKLKILENIALTVCSVLAISSAAIHLTAKDKQEATARTIPLTNTAIATGVAGIALGKFNSKRLEKTQQQLQIKQSQLQKQINSDKEYFENRVEKILP